MEKECIRCHRQFYPSQEGASLCAECLKAEFKVPAPAFDEEEHQELVDEYEAQGKRQVSRAARMGEGYRSGALFGWRTHLRFCFAIALFLFCLIIFSMSGDNQQGGADDMDLLGRRIVSLLLCLVSAVLICSSTRRIWIYPIGLAILISGWFLPDLSKLEEMQNNAYPTTSAMTEEGEDEAAEVAEARALQTTDLDVFFQQKNEDPQSVHYAVYMNRQDAHTRSIVRDALNRLLGAEFTRAYTRNDGALFVVSRARGRMKNISRTLSRFGHITYSDPAEGIYEVRFEPDRVNLVSRYPVEVLAEPSNSAYVSANIEELACLDPMRIRSAAKNLHQSNVQMLRNEVRETLLMVMQDPWTSDYDTYSALAEAMTTYAAAQKDAAAIDACRKFFRVGLAMKREIPTDVTHYLVKEVPDEMVEPIVEFWCENPIAWTDTMSRLGLRTQAPLLEKLRQTNNLRSIGTIIRYLKDYGDAQALSDIKPFLTHQDAIIRHSAQDAIRAIEARKK